jgi:hypothetical protein
VNDWDELTALDPLEAGLVDRVGPPGEDAMRLLQMHEYLGLLRQGSTSIELDPLVARQGLAAAQEIWADTGLAAWDAQSRHIEEVARTNGGHLLCHVNADHRNCFVIVVIDGVSRRPDSYIVFDIGAQYRGLPTFICPPIDHEGEPTEELIAAAIPKLMSEPNGFAVLDLAPGTYMQTAADGPDQYVLEHQLVTTRCHYRVPRPVDAATVIDAFKSYAFGKFEWASNLRWERMEL